jgi:hypothetical protein
MERCAHVSLIGRSAPCWIRIQAMYPRDHPPWCSGRRDKSRRMTPMLPYRMQNSCRVVQIDVRRGLRSEAGCIGISSRWGWPAAVRVTQRYAELLDILKSSSANDSGIGADLQPALAMRERKAHMRRCARPADARGSNGLAYHQGAVAASTSTLCRLDSGWRVNTQRVWHHRSRF